MKIFNNTKKIITLILAVLILAGCTQTGGNADMQNTSAAAATGNPTDAQEDTKITPAPSATGPDASAAAVIPTEQPGPSPTRFAAYTAYICTNGGRANVRRQPSAQAEIITRLEKGTQVQVTETGQDFSKVFFGQNEAGYISNSLLSRDFVAYTNFWGNTPENLSAGGYVAAQGEDVYVSLSGKGIYHYDGNTKVWNHMGVNDSGVYYTNLNVIGTALYTVSAYYIFKMDIKTGNMLEIYNAHGEGSIPLSILAVDGGLYCGGQDKLVRLDSNGKIQQTYWQEKGTVFSGLTYDQERLYYKKSQSTQQFYSMEFDGTNQKCLLEDSPAAPTVYFAVSDGQMLAAVNNTSLSYGKLQAQAALQPLETQYPAGYHSFFMDNTLYYIDIVENNNQPQKIYSQSLGSTQSRVLYANTNVQGSEYFRNMDILGGANGRIYFSVYSYALPESIKLYSMLPDGSGLRMETEVVGTIPRG